MLRQMKRLVFGIVVAAVLLVAGSAVGLRSQSASATTGPWEIYQVQPNGDIICQFYTPCSDYLCCGGVTQ